MTFFEFALSGFWTFWGVVILIFVVGRLVLFTVVGLVSAARGIPVRFSSEGKSTPEEIIKAVRDAMEEGKLDAALARSNMRNRQRMT